MKILLLDDNLMSSLKVEGALRAAGHHVVTARKMPQDSDFERVIFNLGSRSLGSLEMVAELRKTLPAAQLWGFCGHREVELWRAARAAGVTKIVTNEAAMRGEFE